MKQESNTNSTRESILDAAYSVFLNKGVGNAGTKEITDMAGVNKAMLYYYFDSKEKLFIEVFRKAVRESGLKTIRVLEEDIPVFDKIRKYIDTFIDRLVDQPLTSSFVVTELNRYPDLLTGVLLNEIEYDSSTLDKQLSEAADRYEVARVDSKQLLVNIISLCLGPVVYKNYYLGILEIENESAYTTFLEKRKGIIYDMTISWLTT